MKGGIVICVPAFGGTVCAQTAKSLYDTSQLLTSEGVFSRMTWLAMTGIADLRNLFLTIWYDVHKECSHILFVDADMHFPANLVWDMYCFDKPVTGVFYAKRNFPIEVVGNVLNDTDTSDNVVRGFLKVDSVGAGVMMIQRKAIDAMLERMPEISDATTGHQTAATLKANNCTRLIRAFDHLKGPDGEIPEDLSFCKRWNDCGGVIWSNVYYPIGHVGTFEYAIRYYDFLEQRKQEKKAQAA